MSTRPPERTVYLTIGVMLASVALNIIVAALHGWGPDPWWQTGISVVLTTLAIGWVWGVFGARQESHDREKRHATTM